MEILGVKSSLDNIIIRKANVGDAAALRVLRLEALQLNPEAFGGDYDESRIKTTEWWQEKILTGEQTYKDFMSIAEIQTNSSATLIGMTGLYRGGNPKSRHSGTVYGVYVKPEWRGKHIAETMIKTCLDWARGIELRVVRLAVITTNTAAIRCYLRCGFRVYGIEPLSIHWNGIDYDELMMYQLI